jgi:cellulose synthase/poly-beta-1,6-N-acetylglucosamine synthase-like glycosyltransferase
MNKSIYIPIVIWLIIGCFMAFNTTESSNSILGILQLIWLTPIIYAGSNLLGFTTKDRNFYISSDKQFRYTALWVSRGNNQEALYNSIQQSIINYLESKISTMTKNVLVDMVDFVVISDIEIEKKRKVGGVKYLVVKKSFTTKNQVKYKARALEYARKFIKTPYTLHLDEESVITKEAYQGINDFFNTNDKNTIGQGLILYSSDVNKYVNNLNNKLIPIELIDAVRSGDDLGRFKFQYSILHKPIFGMHGSFMLIPKSVSDSITWDLPSHSITEDAEFAILAYSKGYKFNWIKGHIQEQSPQTIKDLITQRKRWFTGLVTVVLNNNTPLKYKLSLLTMISLWSVSWIIPIVTILSLILGGSYLPPILIILTSLITGITFSVYFVGLNANLKAINRKVSILVYIKLCLLLILQIIPIIEGIGVLMAIVKPPKKFEVIKKV